MDGRVTSRHCGYPPRHALTPCVPVRDDDDARSRVQNYRASMNVCPHSWRVYFEVQASQVERQFLQ
jgi:hypothetical protein